jgi:hypothetical protein
MIHSLQPCPPIPSWPCSKDLQKYGTFTFLKLQWNIVKNDYKSEENWSKTQNNSFLGELYTSIKSESQGNDFIGAINHRDFISEKSLTRISTTDNFQQIYHFLLLHTWPLPLNVCWPESNLIVLNNKKKIFQCTFTGAGPRLLFPASPHPSDSLCYAGRWPQNTDKNMLY